MGAAAVVPAGIASPNNAVVVTDAAGEVHGLSHVHTHDERDFRHPMSPHLGEIEGDPITQIQVHSFGPILNRHQTQFCVGHGWTLFLTSAPRLTAPGPDPFRIYHEAQELVRRRANYYGTSVRAGGEGHATGPVGITFIDEETGQQARFAGTYKIEAYKPAPTQ
jgi:hypothetical protein